MKMKFLLRRAFLAFHVLALGGMIPAKGQHQTTVLDEPHVGASLPYSVEIREVSLSPAPLPNIHSVAAGMWEGHWILMAGRTNGLHGMTGQNGFDPVYENREVWVIDPLGRRSWRKSLESSPASGLSPDQVDSLSAVNTEFYQDDDTLFVVGGYGFKRSVNDYRTYDTLTAIDLPGLVAWVKAAPGEEATMARDHIKQIKDSYFQVTGGSLEKMGDEFQLIFGQDYPGRYRPNFNGTYTRQVRRFKVTLDAEGVPTVPLSSRLATPVNEFFRRRDLNVVPLVERTGLNEFEEKAVVLSGVFTPENGVWTVPVLVGAGGSVVMDPPEADDTLKQGFQVYHCAKASLYHRVTDESHCLLLGGLTVLERNLSDGTYTRDDRVPFTNQCSVVVRDGAGQFRQYWLPTRFPLIESNGLELRFGTNAEFFPSPDLPQLAPKVLELASMTGEVVIGHIFGGIFADAGNSGNTGASGRVFEVVLQPLGNAPHLTLFNQELSWRPGVAGSSSYLMESSSNLRDWQEEAIGLKKTSLPLPVNPSSKRFFRVLGATVTSP